MTFVPANVDAALIRAFGSTVTYTPDGGSPTPILGLFQNPDVEPDSNTLDFLTQGPMVSVLVTDMPSPSNKDLFTIPVGGTNYQVKDFEVDEGGMVFVQLEETP